MFVIRKIRPALVALGIVGVLALPAAAGERAPKPRMTVTQITQDAAGTSLSTAVMIGLAVIMAVTLTNGATGGNAPAG